MEPEPGTGAGVKRQYRVAIDATVAAVGSPSDAVPPWWSSMASMVAAVPWPTTTSSHSMPVADRNVHDTVDPVSNRSPQQFICQLPIHTFVCTEPACQASATAHDCI